VNGQRPALAGQIQRHGAADPARSTGDQDNSTRVHDSYNPRMIDQPASLSAALVSAIAQEISSRGGWIGFDRFMTLALYTPGLGYYSAGRRVFSRMPTGGGDFVTAPELSPLFGRALSNQVEQALRSTATTAIYEFGAGSGALAETLLDALGERVSRYAIVDLSGSLQQRQRERLARFGDRVEWLERWPDAISGVVIGNEVLDAMPVQLLHWDGQDWFERGVALAEQSRAGSRFVWADRLTALRPPSDGPFTAGTVTEIHAQAEAFVTSLAQRMQRGAAIFVDYGFPAAEYYHPQRDGGTLMCHRGHRSDTDPLVDVGDKDITAHVDFTGIALAAQDAGFDVVGYTSQGRFLLNCGIAEMIANADIRQRSEALMLVNEHEMGELFKVIALVKGGAFDPIGFAVGDRCHRL
jgi:SAM-dependent MidA family methyltransferase